MTRTVVRASGLTKRYGTFTAVDAVELNLEENRIYGLLGRNGAGKTTIMQMLTGQLFPDAGELGVFGREPAEHADVLRRMCFIAESQRYPESFKASHVFKAAPWFFEQWDAAFAEQLIADFRLPLNRYIKKLSRGQLSAVGVIVGLASRAPLTFFDEPYRARRSRSSTSPTSGSMPSRGTSSTTGSSRTTPSIPARSCSRRT
jgi:ABC-2 type transport system ATP-binding protein